MNLKKKLASVAVGSALVLSTGLVVGNTINGAAFTNPPSNAVDILWQDYCGRVSDPACVLPTPSPTPTPTAIPTPTPTPVPTATPSDVQPGFPVRAAFYYPWFPESWNQQGINPFTKYHPTLGFYDSSSTSVIQNHITNMEYANIKVAIASWWGQGTPTDNRISTLLNTTTDNFRWSLYYEAEGASNPTATQITSDLSYIKSHYGANKAFYRIGGKPVIFVYADGTDGCGMADRWKQANTQGFYVVLKVFGGYTACASQPDNWHQYSPAAATDSQAGHSYGISPGFNKAGEASARLVRDLTRWSSNVKSMVASGAPFQLVTTWNEWGEGTSVESATEWNNAYLDVLHTNGAGTTPTPTPTPIPTSTPIPTPTPVPTPTPSSGTVTSITIAAAGDIACDPGSNTGAPGNCDQSATAQQITALNPSLVLTLGDTQYESNTSAAFASVFNSTWGVFKSKIHPAIGNHEYLTTNATGYFGYFGTAAGDPTKGYYSFDAGGWHFMSINSECSHIGGCASGNPQEAWVKADLAANAGKCILAYWHEPRWSNGQHGNATQMTTIWNDLVAGHATLVLNGHNHDYERYAPMNATGAKSSTGVREFVVGTGGKNHYAITAAPLAGEELSNDKTFGIMKLVLNSNKTYTWQFLPAPGYSFTDAGSGTCPA